MNRSFTVRNLLLIMWMIIYALFSKYNLLIGHIHPNARFMLFYIPVFFIFRIKKNIHILLTLSLLLITSIALNKGALTEAEISVRLVYFFIVIAVLQLLSGSRNL